MRNKSLLLLLLITGLLFLATCQSTGYPLATSENDVAPSPTFTPNLESREEAGGKERAGESNPRPTIESQPAPQGGPENEPGVESSSQPPTARATEPGQATPSPQPLASSPPPSPTRAAESGRATPTPLPFARGGRIVVGGLGRPDTLNPLLAESEASHALMPLLFDSLLAYDPDSGRLIPHLAADWIVAGDSRTITFTLRTDLRWHDGRPLVADDVVFSIEAARDPALDSLYGPQLEHVTEVNAPDEGTVVVSLNDAHCPSLAVLGELPIVPRHLLTHPDSDSGSFGRAPIGSGPFVFIDWAPDGEVHLAPNDDYRAGAPYLDAWTYRPFENAADLQHAWEIGQIDVALMPPGPLPGLTDPSLVLSYPLPEFLFVAFNNDRPLLGDSRVRLALSMAVDREQLLDRALDGRGELIAGTLPSTHWAADPTLRPPPYDPDAARRLLAEAGWIDTDGDGWLDQEGERLRLPIRTNGGNRLREDVTTLVAGYYRAIGIDASVELVVWGAVVDDLFTHDFEVIVFSWPLQADPDQRSWWLSTENEIGIGYNFVSFANEMVDRLLQEALTVPGCNASRRAERYQQIQHLLAQERPYDFLLIPHAAVLTRPGLHGVVTGPFAGPLQSAAGWYIVP